MAIIKSLTDNLFISAFHFQNDVHFNIGGGRDNVARYNVLFDARAHSIQLDNRGMGPGNHSEYLRRLLAVSILHNITIKYETIRWKFNTCMIKFENGFGKVKPNLKNKNIKCTTKRK